MDFSLTDEQKQLRHSIREFAEGEIAPHVMEWDESSRFPTEIIVAGQISAELLDNLLHLIVQHRWILLIGSNRITSYNVCYTKLLRMTGRMTLRSSGLDVSFISPSRHHILSAASSENPFTPSLRHATMHAQSSLRHTNDPGENQR